MAKSKFVIDFRTNFVNSDYCAKLLYRCSTANEIRNAQAAMCDYLNQKIIEYESEERRKEAELWK